MRKTYFDMLSSFSNSANIVQSGKFMIKPWKLCFSTMMEL